MWLLPFDWCCYWITFVRRSGRVLDELWCRRAQLQRTRGDNEESTPLGLDEPNEAEWCNEDECDHEHAEQEGRHRTPTEWAGQPMPVLGVFTEVLVEEVVQERSHDRAGVRRGPAEEQREEIDDRVADGEAGHR